MGFHRTAVFFHRGIRKLVLCDSPDGSSALTALYNCLSLSHQEYREEIQRPYMEDEQIKGSLLKLLASNVAILVGIGDESSASLIEKKPDCERLINDCNHNRDIELSPILEGIGFFLESDFYYLSVLVGEKLLHGWVVSPTAPKKTYDNVKDHTFDDLELRLGLLMNMKARETDLEELAALAAECDLVNDLLNDADKQCTTEGYKMLCNELKDGDFAIYYWNKRFCVIHKNGNDLLTLETNPNVLSLSSNITWRVFPEVEGENRYLTSDYVPVVQLNIEKEVLFRGNNEQQSNDIEKAEEAKNEMLTKNQRKRAKDKLKKLAKKEKLAKSQEDGAGATLDGQISGQQGKHLAAGQQLQSPENTIGKEVSESAMQQLEEEDQGGGSSNEQTAVGDGPQMTRTQKRRKDRKNKKLSVKQQVKNAKEDEEVAENSVQQTYEDVERKAEKEEHKDNAPDKHGETNEENEGESSNLPQEEEKPESEIYKDFEDFLLKILILVLYKYHTLLPLII